MALCCSQAEAKYGAPGAKEKAKHDAKNNSALHGASGPGQQFCSGLQLEIWPFIFLFPCPNLGINLFVRTAAENQLVKGTNECQMQVFHLRKYAEMIH